MPLEQKRQGRFLPGTPEFRNAFNQVTRSVTTGSKLVDKNHH
jgi:hypothetical protein